MEIAPLGAFLGYTRHLKSNGLLVKYMQYYNLHHKHNYYLSLQLLTNLYIYAYIFMIDSK